MDKPPRPRRWDAVKWIGFALFLVGSGAGGMAALANKADRAELAVVELRVAASERRLERIETDAQWIKSALWALTKHAGVPVSPPPGP